MSKEQVEKLKQYVYTHKFFNEFCPQYYDVWRHTPKKHIENLRKKTPIDTNESYLVECPSMRGLQAFIGEFLIQRASKEQYFKWVAINADEFVSLRLGKVELTEFEDAGIIDIGVLIIYVHQYQKELGKSDVLLRSMILSEVANRRRKDRNLVTLVVTERRLPELQASNELNYIHLDKFLNPYEYTVASSDVSTNVSNIQTITTTTESSSAVLDSNAMRRMNETKGAD